MSSNLKFFTIISTCSRAWGHVLCHFPPLVMFNVVSCLDKVSNVTGSSRNAVKPCFSTFADCWSLNPEIGVSPADLSGWIHSVWTVLLTRPSLRVSAWRHTATCLKCKYTSQHGTTSASDVWLSPHGSITQTPPDTTSLCNRCDAHSHCSYRN